MTFFRRLLFFIFLLFWGTAAYSQGKFSLYVEPVLWSQIESRLDQTTRYEFIPELVSRHFVQQPDSVNRNLYAVMIRLERLYNLNAAIYVGEEIARRGKEADSPSLEATAYTNLARYYDALGTYQLAATNTEKALAIHQKLGDEKTVLDAEYYILALKLHFVSRQEVIPLLEDLLQKAVAQGTQGLVRKIHLQLLEQNILVGKYAKAEQHITYLEKIPVSNPIKPQEYPYLMNFTKCKGDLALARNNLMEAERYYQQTLQYSQAEPGLWMEINSLLDLTRVALLRRNVNQAKTYLEDARRKAEKLQLDDLLALTYTFKSSIAELENNPDDALRFLKKKIFHEEKFNARSEGFNLENFYLQAERDKLAANEKNHELELSLKNSQLTYSIVILALIALLAAGLVLEYIRQSRSKAELARKNALIQQHADQLQSLDAAKTRFFANVSHELRTPLSLIMGPISSLLKEEQFSKKHQLLLKTINRSARQLEVMVKDILDLRKLDAGKMSLNPELTELESFFQVHLGQFESLAQWKQIRYSHEVRITPGLFAELDREKCRQILYNLLSNAIKFTPATGKVDVAVELKAGLLSLKVADTGPGIPAEDLPYVFERFFQTSQKGQFSAGGTGIGLSICHDYVGLMQGNIRVDSKPNEGSVFHASWPVTFSEASEGTPAPLLVQDIDELYEGTGPIAEVLAENAAPGAAATPKQTILVVEDNPGLRDYMGLVLGEKYQVIFAEHGEVALQKLTSGSQPVDLILSDLMMPVMDGYQLLEKLKSTDTTRHIPIVMLTARAEPADRLHALRIGVDDYLTKPFDEEELLVRVANLLKNLSIRKQEISVENKVTEERPLLSASDQVWLENFEKHIRANLASDIINVPALSETFAMSESTLLRQLKRLTGLSPVQYLLEIRLNEARSVLEKGTPVTISTLASQVGYKDARSFSRSFKKRFGKLPSDLA